MLTYLIADVDQLVCKKENLHIQNKQKATTTTPKQMHNFTHEPLPGRSSVKIALAKATAVPGSRELRKMRNYWNEGK